MVRGLAAMSLFGLVESAGTGGLAFSLIEAPFRLSGDMLRIDDALARGPSLGLTLSGSWDRAADRLDLRGVMSPAYALNGLLNRVPLVGALLGGDGEGLIGVTFAVTGPAGDPQVAANPFSALAPGALRGVFDGAPADGAPASDPQPSRVDR
jgi:hypothetical protein